MKILNTWWFNEIGIVITENEIKERKAYIGVCMGGSEANDAQHIADWGTKVSALELTDIIRWLEKLNKRSKK